MRKSIDDTNISELYMEMVSGDVFGGSDISAGIENEDDYAPGDARIPSLLGVQTRNGKIKPKKKRKSFRKMFDSKK